MITLDDDTAKILGMGFIYLINDDSDYNFFNKASISIFGYLTNNRITLDVYKLYQGFIFEINNYISIDNNLFGYELNIKITSVSNGLTGIRFFSINENREINRNELIDKEDSILFDFSGVNAQLGKKDIIEITQSIITPEFDKLDDYYDKSETFGGGEQFIDFYESTILEEKKFTIELTFVCSESITSSCTYPDLTTKTIQNGSNEILFLSNFI